MDWGGCGGKGAQFAEWFWVQLEGGWCGRIGGSGAQEVWRGKCGEQGG